MTFAEYLEDICDLHIGLMSEAEIERARESYELFIAPPASALPPLTRI